MDTTYIKKAAALAGGTSALARAVQVSAPTVFQWISGERPIPLAHCPAIEINTGVRCEQLRPDVEWVRVRGKVTHYKVAVGRAA